VRDGKAALIAGQMPPGEDPAKVPVLGQLPALNRLFSDRMDRKDLVIFLTPQVLVRED